LDLLIGISHFASAVHVFTNLYSFGCSEGRAPEGVLVEGSDGNFCGTTPGGGSINLGAVFRISPGGSLTNIHSFSGGDGKSPYNGLVQGSDGNLYGAASLGGLGGSCFNGCGTLFQISPNGSFTNLYFFGTPPSVGIVPVGGLVQGSDGNFYGTTQGGGTNLNGTIFKLTIPLNPPANQISGIQFSGSDVVLNIPSVAYETYQLQFTPDPASGIWSNIPGASVTNCIGGLLTVTNSGGASQPQRFYRFEITP
jgi:uncharacterized repeat protein (TIGR03803 family)